MRARAAAGVVVLVLAGCGGDDGGSGGDQPGQPEVYDRIESMTDCAGLQAEFDRAAANNEREDAGTPGFDITLSYMNAADDRLREVGCY